MKVVYTDQSLQRLNEALEFSREIESLSEKGLSELVARLFSRAESLALNPYKGQREENLVLLNEDHRRLIEGYYKIIYKIEGDRIYITDFFDSRQDPSKMKG